MSVPVCSLSICKYITLLFFYKVVVKHKGESSILGGMRGGFSLKNLNNSMLAWTGPSLWTACPRVY